MRTLRVVQSIAAVIIASAILPRAAIAQHAAAVLPTQAGQAAFAAIAEIVRMLESDPTTDWSRVNIEALRQHLIDMDDVTLHAVVARRDVARGAEFTVTGTGRTVDAIRRMATNQSQMLDMDARYRANAQPIDGGALVAVTARDAGDAQLVAQIRGLGFIGLMTEGDHHVRHHLALARGDVDPHGMK